MINRLILTYNQCCNLSCDFCYINFHHKIIKDRTYEIIQKAIMYNFNVITFGGGDAFSKKSFRDSCVLAKDNNLFTHVDTNGISIKDSDFSFIEKYVDLIGISLDGLKEQHNKIRKHDNLFEKVNYILEGLNSSRTKIKINSILTAENKMSIHELFIFLKNFSIDRWSIYQFFPISVAKNYINRFEISDMDYDAVLHFLDSEESPFIIEKLKYKDRVNGYVFCDEEGNVYTNNIIGDYIPICSIFDENFLERISGFELLINPKTLNRYT